MDVREIAERVDKLVPNQKQLKLKVLQNLDANLFKLVMDSTSYFPDDANLAVRMIYMRNGKVGPSVCLVCGKETVNITGEGKGKRPSIHCSVKCRYSDKSYTQGRVVGVDQQEKVKRMAATNLKKYGYEFSAQRPDVKPSIKKSKIVCEERLGKLLDREWLISKYMEDMLTLEEIGAEIGVYYGTVADYLRKYGVKIRTSSNRSQFERVIEEVLNTNGVEYIPNDRTLIDGELDFVIPDCKVAIEIDGIYWHSYYDFSHANDHRQKTIDCMNVGYKLLHFTDLQVKNQLPIVSSMILNSIGIHQRKIRASKCIARVIDRDESIAFEKENHISGTAPSSIKIGLEYNGELVSIMTFGKPRFDKDHEYEIIRLCSKLNTVIYGAASKMFRFALQTFDMKSVMTYADRMHGEGTVYENLGFEKTGETALGYFWFKSGKILSRYQTMKKNLQNLFPEYNGEPEREFMSSMGWKMFHNCGNNIYSYK